MVGTGTRRAYQRGKSVNRLPEEKCAFSRAADRAVDKGERLHLGIWGEIEALDTAVSPCDPTEGALLRSVDVLRLSFWSASVLDGKGELVYSPASKIAWP